MLDRHVDISRGDVLSSSKEPLNMTDQFEATVIWMSHDHGLAGRQYEIKLATQESLASLSTIKYRVNVNSFAHEAIDHLSMNDIAVCTFSTTKPLACDCYEKSPPLGGFILIDRLTHATMAAGMIRHSLRRAQNVHKQAMSITRSDRESLQGHRAKVVWLTGLSGSGKSTIANELEKMLHSQGHRTYILDGDNIRQGLNKDLGFTNAARVENIRRVAEVAKLMMDAGLIVITAFISPFQLERDMARDLIGIDSFLEIFVDTPLTICEQRDSKGLYKKARKGLIPNMTGINSSYERPNQPHLVIQGEQCSALNAAQAILKLLK